MFIPLELFVRTWWVPQEQWPVTSGWGTEWDNCKWPLIVWLWRSIEDPKLFLIKRSRNDRKLASDIQSNAMPGNSFVHFHLRVLPKLADVLLQSTTCNGHQILVVCACAQQHLTQPWAWDMQAFMGEVAMWTGIVTGTLMLLSPSLFRMWKWRGVARATPNFLRFTGLPFFLGCIGYALLSRSGHPSVFYLRSLVIMGALLQARPPPSQPLSTLSCLLSCLVYSPAQYGGAAAGTPLSQLAFM